MLIIIKAVRPLFYLFSKIILDCSTVAKVTHRRQENFKLSASTIGAIYKERWEIELFFKTRNVKTFVTLLLQEDISVFGSSWTAVDFVANITDIPICTFYSS